MNTSVPILSFAGAVACASCSWAAAAPDDAFVAERRQGGTAQPATSTQAFAAIDRQAALVERDRNGDLLIYAVDGSAFSLSQKDAHGTVLALGSGGTSGKFFGLEASGLAPLEVSQDNVFNAPYYAMVRDADHAGVSFAMGHGRRLRFGALSGRDTAPESGPLQSEHAKRFLTSAEFEQKLGRAVGIVSVGMLREKGSTLGVQQGQALALNARPTTTFTSVSAGYALTPSSSLVAMASYGKTDGFGSADSLMAQVSTVRTVAYSMGYARNRLWSDDDRLGLTFAIPARVRSGALEAGGASVQTGTLSYAAPLLNLRPTATERDLEMTYSTPFGKDGRLGKVTGAVMFRVNPGHDASARSDWLTGVRYSRGF